MNQNLPIGTTYITVEHGYYGCDSGCCGHRVVCYSKEDHELGVGKFSFEHPYRETDESIPTDEEFAKGLIEAEYQGSSKLLNIEKSSIYDD